MLPLLISSGFRACCRQSWPGDAGSSQISLQVPQKTWPGTRVYVKAALVGVHRLQNRDRGLNAAIQRSPGNKCQSQGFLTHTPAKQAVCVRSLTFICVEHVSMFKRLVKRLYSQTRICRTES